MGRKPARATQADIARAVRAVIQCEVYATIEIAPDGTIRVLVGGPAKPVERKEKIVL